MCTLLLSYRQHEQFPLLIAANRDEFHQRPTRSLHWWEDKPHILGGRDEQEGGTWFGITRHGRLAALTNFRIFPLLDSAPSRGELVSRFLDGSQEPQEFYTWLQQHGQAYNGFNMLFGSADHLWFYSNRGGFEGPLPPGLHGLSNASLNEAWPKVVDSRRHFADLFSRPETLSEEEVFEALGKRQQYADHLLPDTGVGLEKERGLSALFIDLPGYGTRCSWYLKVSHRGEVELSERTYLPPSEQRESFQLKPGKED